MKRNDIVDNVSELINRVHGRVNSSKNYVEEMWSENLFSEEFDKKFQKMTEASKEEVMKFFNDLLKKFKVTSPSQLDKDKKKEFFNTIDAKFVAKGEVPEPGETLNPSANESAPETITQTEYDKIPNNMKVTKDGQNFILRDTVLIPIQVIKEHAYDSFKDLLSENN